MVSRDCISLVLIRRNRVMSLNNRWIAKSLFLIISLLIVSGCGNGQSASDSKNQSLTTNVSKIIVEAPECDRRGYYDPMSKDKRCRELQIALIEASGKGDLEAIKSSIRRGAGIEGTYDQSYSALYTAAQNSRVDAVLLLLENGADINRVFSFRKTPLTVAVLSEKSEIVKVLLERGADVCGYMDDNSNTLEDSPIKIAQKNNNKEIIDMLEKAIAKQCKNKK